MHLIDRQGNETSPLFSIDDQRRHRMVIDNEENKVMFKDRPDEWHTLPTTKKGLMMIPLTKEACENIKQSLHPSTSSDEGSQQEEEGKEVRGPDVHRTALVRGRQGEACI